jgi:hypothetical protein
VAVANDGCWGTYVCLRFFLLCLFSLFVLCFAAFANIHNSSKLSLFFFFLLKDAYHPWTFGIFKFTPWTFQFWLWPYLNYFLLKSSNSTSFCRIYLNKVMDFCMWITWLLTKNEKKRFWRRMYHATRYGILLFFLINK